MIVLIHEKSCIALVILVNTFVFQTATIDLSQERRRRCVSGRLPHHEAHIRPRSHPRGKLLGLHYRNGLFRSVAIASVYRRHLRTALGQR